MLFAHRPEMSDSPSLLRLSPSLKSAHSSTRLTDIAARVVRELRDDDDVPEYEDHFIYGDDGEANNTGSTPISYNSTSSKSKPEEEEEEEEFEFSFACKQPAASPVSADEIFLNGRIKPLYSISMSIPIVLKKAEKRMPLRMLLTEERDSSLSCSSSEADDLEALPPGTYCVWKPKTTSSEDSCRKSKSTGTSRRWRFRNLLHRSNSDGKDTLVFFAKKEKEDGYPEPEDHHQGHDKSKRRPLDLVGVFSNVNGLSRNLRPF